MGEQHIKARIAGRKMAAELLPLLEWEDGTGADYADSLCETLRDHLPKRKEDKPRTTMIPLARLAMTRMPFGLHGGKRLDEIDPDYLDWLCREQEEFYKVLRAFLTHPERSE